MAAAAAECTLYALQCKKGKYYIGRVNGPSVEARFMQHCSGEGGSTWTQMYEPLKVDDQKTGTVYDEDSWTLRYMAKYGVENVRGGTYCQPQLSQDQLDEIKRKIDGAHDKCFRCGSGDHFAANCPVVSVPNRRSRSRSRSPVRRQQALQCFRCGHSSHFARECYAKHDINGQRLSDDEDEDDEDEEDSDDDD